MPANPNPGPDPAAVRAALERIDASSRAFKDDRLTCMQYRYRLADCSDLLAAAARAWLAQQEASE